LKIIYVYRRIKKEFKDLMKDCPANCSAAPVSDKDMYKWEGFFFVFH
jgi:ubiquitin-protein ligase